MTSVLVIGALCLSLLWMPLSMKFLAAWRTRKNPVSLAIFAMMLMLTYTNIIFAVALIGEASWRFYAVATRVFELVICVNFFVAFRWSDTKFSGNRKTDTIPPPMA